VLGLRDNGGFFGGVEASGTTCRSGELAVFGVTMPILDDLRFRSDPFVDVSRSRKEGIHTVRLFQKT
jgi:hypothetical protein